MLACRHQALWKIHQNMEKNQDVTSKQLHLESVVAFLDRVPSFLLGSCVRFSSPLLVADAVATIADMKVNAN